MIRFATIFTDHAVLQRETPLPVWGWTQPLSRVDVSLNGYHAEFLSGADGKFLVRLPALPAGGPYELVATAPETGETAVCRDVWIGEVWLASGQSNMQWKLGQLSAAMQANAPADPSIRMATVENHAYAGRQQEAEVRWREATPETIKDFSATAYFFAREICQRLKVKVGILNASCGGTSIETWLPREALYRLPETSALVRDYEAKIFRPEYWQPYRGVDLKDPACRNMPHADSRIYPSDPGITDKSAGWAAGTDDGGWQAMRIPGTWNEQGHPYSGVFWFCKEVDLASEWVGKPLELHIGRADKHDITFFNGIRVGATGKDLEEQYWNVERHYAIPGELVRAGRNIIAVRVYSFVFSGGLIGPTEAMRLHPVALPQQALGLAGVWNCRIERKFGVIAPHLPPTEPGPGCPNTPGILYDNMIAPLMPYALRGALWYQGEGNAEEGLTAVHEKNYGAVLRELVRVWRYEWGQGDFAFGAVQLARFRKQAAHEPESRWARMREQQLYLLCEPQTGVACIIDTGEEENVHPDDKKTAGQRLARWALSRVYGKSGMSAGPLFKRAQVEQGALRLFFCHAENGLRAMPQFSAPDPEEIVNGFFIAGAERIFLQAQARIEGSTVVVSHPAISSPRAVRYAWADNPSEVTLYNVEGMPAFPFRTDDW